MLDNYSKEEYQKWTIFHGNTFFRKLEYETAFDGCIKIYSLTTDKNAINKILSELFFHNFAVKTKNGVLLRQFESKKSWPKTMLVHFNFDTMEFKTIKKSKSSYDFWLVEEIEKDTYSIKLSPNEIVIFENK